MVDADSLEILSSLLRSDGRVQGTTAAWAHRHGLPPGLATEGRKRVERLLDVVAERLLAGDLTSIAAAADAIARGAESRGERRRAVCFAVDRALDIHRHADIPAGDLPRVNMLDVGRQLRDELVQIESAFESVNAENVAMILLSVPRLNAIADEDDEPEIHPSVPTLCAKLSLRCAAFGDAIEDSDAKGGRFASPETGAIDRVAKAFRAAVVRKA